MKTNAANKKGKKQTVDAAFLIPKPDQKKLNALQSKELTVKSLYASVGNGHRRITHKSKEQALKEIAESVQKKKQETLRRQQNNTVGSLKQVAKTHAKDQTIKSAETKKDQIKSAETKKDAKGGKNQKLLEKTQAKRALARERGKRERKFQFADLNAEQLKSRIEQILKRETLSKTAKRKLSVLNKRLNLLEPGTVFKRAHATEKSDKKDKQEEKSEEIVKTKQELNVDKKKAKAKPQDKKTKIEAEKDVSDEDQSDVEEEEEDDEDDVDIDEDDDNDSMEIDDADSIDDSEDVSDDDESEEEIVSEEKSKKIINQKKTAVVQSSPNQKKEGKQNKNAGKFQKGGKANVPTKGKKNSWKTGNFRGPRA